MKKAIKKAIEGGYDFDFKWSGKENASPNLKVALLQAEQEILLLDPLFWQALGKVDGVMGTKCYECAECKQDIKDTLKWLKSFDGEPCWRHAWHSFIDHLAEGKDINSFFEELLK